MTHVLLADDSAIMRQAVAALLAGEPDIAVVGEAADGREAVEQTRRLRPDVVLMDLKMPVMDGIEATRIICGEQPAVRVIALSMYEGGDGAEAMRRAGAVDYLVKSGSPEALVAAIRRRGRR